MTWKKTDGYLRQEKERRKESLFTIRFLIGQIDLIFVIYL